MANIHIKAAFRQVWKNKLFSAINIIGLSVGLASVMALMVGVYMYNTADSMHRDKDRMYYLKSTSANGSEYMQTTYPLLDEILKTCPEVEAGTHAQTFDNPWLQYNEKEAQGQTVFVDTGFFGVFSFPLKYGNTATALKEKYSAVISETIARQLFGDENAVGKTITAFDTIPLTVTGVMQNIPTNSSVKGEVFLSTGLLKANADFVDMANWYNGFALNFLKLRPGADVEAFDKKVGRLVALNYAEGRNADKVRAVAFSNMRNEAGPVVNVIITGSVATAIFILLILLVNLLNLNAADMYSRTREVAVKKIVGSSKINIIKQFCLENALIVFSSMLLAAILFNSILLPKLNELYGSRFGDLSLSLRDDWVFVLLFIMVAFVITIAAGTLPAIKLISVKVSDAIKGSIANTGNNRGVRNAFIALQFTLAIVFICITIILNRQVEYMKNASLGFNKDDVTIVKLDLAFKNQEAAATHFTTLLNQLKSKPYVKAVSTNSVIPTAYWQNFNSYIDPLTNREVNMRHAGADAGFTTTYKIPVIEGRDFEDALSASEGKSIMINRTAMNALGWATAVGKQLKSKGSEDLYTVVGVMEDFHYQDMQNPIEPLIHWYGGKAGLGDNAYLSIRTQGNHSGELAELLAAGFKTMPGRRPLKIEWMNNLVSKQYALIDGILTTTNFVAMLTIIMSCMGMFGLISLFAKQRIKEIGIRKVLGAKVLQIVFLLSKDFAKLIVIACVIAFPIAWFAMHNWLQSFSYRINIQWWMFAIAGILAAVIAFCTIGFQAVRAAVANPVKSLRTE